MNHSNLESYIQQKLTDLDKQKDLQDVIYKGKLSFGIDSTTYSHLPSWSELVKRSKQLKRLFWINGFFISFMALAIGGNFFESDVSVWWKDVLRLLLTACIVMFFSTAGMYFSLFLKFREAEREVRKLIYQDILFQLKREKETV